MIGESYWCLWLIGTNKKLGNANAVADISVKGVITHQPNHISVTFCGDLVLQTFATVIIDMMIKI